MGQSDVEEVRSGGRRRRKKKEEEEEEGSRSPEESKIPCSQPQTHGVIAGWMLHTDADLMSARTN